MIPVTVYYINCMMGVDVSPVTVYCTNFTFDNYIHITRPEEKKLYLIVTFRSPIADFFRHVVT